MKYLLKVDKQIADLITKEAKRQEDSLMMIPSENSTSSAVNEALSSVFGNKYSEGYSNRRFYQGQKYADALEDLVISRAKKLFKVNHVNVQPYSGSPANLAIILGVAKPGDTILGQSLASGGHLTHGSPVSHTSRIFNAIQYQSTKGGFIDYTEIHRLAKKHKPIVIIAGPTAYPRIIDWKQIGIISDEVGAYFLADISHLSGLIAGRVYPSPVPYADIVMTTTHKSLRGPRGAMIMITEKGLSKDPNLAQKIDKSVFPGLQGGPHMNTIAGIGVCLKEASTPAFKKYARQILENAHTLGSELEKHGFHLVTGGTDSHLILIDFQSHHVLGNTVAEALEYVGIICNKNAVPFDPNPPFYPSGVRIGTPGITSRGLKESQVKIIAEVIHKTVIEISASKKMLNISDKDEKNYQNRKKIIQNAKNLSEQKKIIHSLCSKFPIPHTY